MYLEADVMLCSPQKKAQLKGRSSKRVAPKPDPYLAMKMSQKIKATELTLASSPDGSVMSATFCNSRCSHSHQMTAAVAAATAVSEAATDTFTD